MRRGARWRVAAFCFLALVTVFVSARSATDEVEEQVRGRSCLQPLPDTAGFGMRVLKRGRDKGKGKVDSRGRESTDLVFLPLNE